MKKPISDFDAFLAEQLKIPAVAAAYEEEKEKLDLAIQILNLRNRAGLSQKDLAARLGTTQSVIARLENPEYTGHSVRMLRRIAAAVGQRVRIEFEAIGHPSHGGDRRRLARHRKASGA